MAAATTPRSPPQQPAPGVRRRRWAPATTHHLGHFERPKQPQLCCLPFALHPFLSVFPRLHLLGFSVGIRPGRFGHRRRGSCAPPLPPLSGPPPMSRWWRPASSPAPARRRCSGSHYLPHCYQAATGNACPQQEVMMPRSRPTSPLPAREPIPGESSERLGGRKRRTACYATRRAAVWKRKAAAPPTTWQPHPPPPFWIVARNLRSRPVGISVFPFWKLEDVSLRLREALRRERDRRCYSNLTSVSQFGIYLLGVLCTSSAAVDVGDTAEI